MAVKGFDDFQVFEELDHLSLGEAWAFHDRSRQNPESGSLLQQRNRSPTAITSRRLVIDEQQCILRRI
ncbi:hypothetical protein DOTSEDRAFT_46734 [Dothistroma septosporum NZE10]|uniref:Uncharacterized protein n=1 Tax=Dothistroma septosporum (strain NZE10 / CBS 128990) TaxID=675120 RepID=N1PI88_DOTSN|nr:hypothetical protein DOTSEDRAFT_46734 [Dothistroma septosporum NZE10]